MNGLAKLLKALFPRLNWETPENCLRSAAPAGLDIDGMVNFVNNVPRMMQTLAERQARIEINIQILVDEIEKAKQHGNTHNRSHAGARAIGAGAGNHR
jgi:hypothetical protein